VALTGASCIFRGRLGTCTFLELCRKWELVHVLLHASGTIAVFVDSTVAVAADVATVAAPAAAVAVASGNEQRCSCGMYAEATKH
jgi:hypothetical protein